MQQICSGRMKLLCLMASCALVTAACSSQPNLSPNDSPDRSLRLVFFTDVHARAEWETPNALMKAARTINSYQPDLVIGGGDLITDGFQSSAASVAHRWDVYMSMHNALDGEVHSVIGNHDLVAAIPIDGSEPSADPRSVFRDRLDVARTYYSFDINGYHVVLLDSIQVTNADTKYKGLVSPSQLEWLKHDLSRVPHDQPIIVALHIPLLTSYYQATEGGISAAPAARVVVNNLEVLDMFRDHNLVLVLQGHMHVSEYLQWKDTVFVTGGAVCGKWWRGTWHGTEEGFALITLRDNEVDWEYVTYGWQARRPPNQ